MSRKNRPRARQDRRDAKSRKKQWRNRIILPNDEDRARASKLMKTRHRNLHAVCESLLQHFRGRCGLHACWIFAEGEAHFRAFLFFEKDDDVLRNRQIGIERKIIDFVYSELERAGRGSRGDITVAFDFDSDKRARTKYGSWFNKLR